MPYALPAAEDVALKFKNLGERLDIYSRMDAVLHTFSLLLLLLKASAFVPGSAPPFRRLSPLASSNTPTPPWRYELDDLIKAASPWGSFVEAEIIATDLGERQAEITERRYNY